VLTAAGPVRLRRVYLVCRQCKLRVHPGDGRLGVTGPASPQAQRLLCLAGTSWSFDSAAKHLREFCGLSVSDNWIREVCQQRAAQMEAWQTTAGQARLPFRQAHGDVEFTTDGTSVNTREGWREMRRGIFSRRLRGEPASVADWDHRQLPAPRVRVAFAAIENSEQFGTRWGQWASRLGVHDTSQLTVLADGAAWIWDQANLHVAGAMGVLDIYHGLEHVAQTAHDLYGKGVAQAEEWLTAGRTALLSSGWQGIRDQIIQTQRTVCDTAKRASLESLRNYLGKHSHHLHYAERLAEGRSIGSGQVEGACKHMIGRRLKQTGVRWTLPRVNRMATLCAILYSDHWDAYWAAPEPP
jgi:hypothetical protein